MTTGASAATRGRGCSAELCSGSGSGGGGDGAEPSRDAARRSRRRSNSNSICRSEVRSRSMLRVCLPVRLPVCLPVRLPARVHHVRVRVFSVSHPPSCAHMFFFVVRRSASIAWTPVVDGRKRPGQVGCDERRPRTTAGGVSHGTAVGRGTSKTRCPLRLEERAGQILFKVIDVDRREATCAPPSSINLMGTSRARATAKFGDARHIQRL